MENLTDSQVVLKVFPEARATKDVFYLGGKSEHRCSFELVGLLVDVVRFLDAKGFSVRGHREISNQIPLSICTKEGKFLFGVMLAERQAGKYNGIQLDKCLYIYKIEKGKKGKGIVDLNVLIEIADEHNEKLYGKDVEVKKYSLSKVSRNAWGGFKPGEFLIEEAGIGYSSCLGIPKVGDRFVCCIHTSTQTGGGYYDDTYTLRGEVIRSSGVSSWVSPEYEEKTSYVVYEIAE